MNPWRLLTFVLTVITFAGSVQGATVYVDANATGANNGTSWTDAYTNPALALAAGGNDDIWVARGTYYPGEDRASSFQMKQNTAMYGGFTNGMASFSDRNWELYETVLSGDIGIAGVNTDNCYHVVLGVSNAILDGFTVTRGCSTNSSVVGETQQGAGMYVSNCSPIIANCLFSVNYATNGGGLYMRDGTARVENCRFISNSAKIAGGGLSAKSWGGAILSCTFASNSCATMGAGAYLLGYRGTPVISNCVFSTNIGCSYGGAMRLEEWSGRVLNSKFFMNDAFIGGAISTHFTETTITGCMFAANTGGGGGYGGAISYIYSGGPGYSNDRTNTLTHCIFSGNQGDMGGAIYVLSNVSISNCQFVGNLSYSLYSDQQGGAIFVPSYTYGGLQLRNSLLAGNVDSGLIGGGGIVFKGKRGLIENCTIVSNRANVSGGGVFNTNTLLTLRNSILWGNSAAKTGAEHYVAGAATSIVSYTDTKGGLAGNGVVTQGVGSVTDAGGNIEGEPRFVGGPSGQWTAAGGFNGNLGQSTLTDSGAAWTPNAFAGLTVNPDVTQWLQFSIVSNSATTITVWGNVAWIAHLNDAYQILDYHEQSRGGHWTANGWVVDLLSSACIDAGDPEYSYAQEPWPNGRRINMGAYGNTYQASKRAVPTGTIFSFR